MRRVETSKDCSECDGLGVTECECAECREIHERTCRKCDGSGNADSPDVYFLPDPGELLCWMCNGFGHLRVSTCSATPCDDGRECWVCGGSGAIVLDGVVS